MALSSRLDQTGHLASDFIFEIDRMTLFNPNFILKRFKFSSRLEPLKVIFNNTIGGVMEIASQIALVLLMDRAWCGRKRLLIGKLIVDFIKRC